MGKPSRGDKQLFWDKLIVALDLEDKGKIQEVINSLSGKGVKVKIGSIAFTKFGPDFVREIVGQSIDVFLDLKLYDIPNTMRKTAGIIVELGCWAFTVHIKAGKEALAAVKKEVENRAAKLKRRKPLILGVTELTSEDADVRQVGKLVDIAADVGLDGVITSAREVSFIKKQNKDISLKLVVPGIRQSGAEQGDQKRVFTAGFAFSHGADYIVVGRPIIKEEDYLLAARHILEG